MNKETRYRFLVVIAVNGEIKVLRSTNYYDDALDFFIEEEKLLAQDMMWDYGNFTIIWPSSDDVRVLEKAFKEYDVKRATIVRGGYGRRSKSVLVGLLSRKL